MIYYDVYWIEHQELDDTVGSPARGIVVVIKTICSILRSACIVLYYYNNNTGGWVLYELLLMASNNII